MVTQRRKPSARARLTSAYATVIQVLALTVSPEHINTESRSTNHVKKEDRRMLRLILGRAMSLRIAVYPFPGPSLTSLIRFAHSVQQMLWAPVISTSLNTDAYDLSLVHLTPT